MPPHYILHVGPHKTGSTYLQTCLFASRQMLEVAGVHFASLWNESAIKPSQTGLVQRMNTERRGELQRVFDDWRGSAYRKIVISCEELAAMSREPVKIQMLRELTDGCPVTIVYYVRRWPDLLASEWQEYVKQGSTLQLLEVLVHNLRDPVQSRIINIGVCLSVFAEKFGKASIRLVSYDSVVAGELDIFQHFTATFLDGLTLAAPAGGLIHQSLEPASVELMRIFNCLEQRTGVDSRNLVRFLTLQHKPAPLTTLLAYLEQFALTIEVRDDDPSVSPTLLANRISYALCAVDPVDATWFHPPAIKQLRFIGTGYGIATGFAEAAQKLWQDLLAI